MMQYGDNDMLLVKTLPRSLTGTSFACFTKIKIFNIKWWTLAHLFIEQYKLPPRNKV